MFPYCEILYKPTDSPGWEYGKMNGNKEIVNKKCLEQGWFNFIVFDGSSCAWEIADEFPSEIDPYSLHLLSDWIYSNELNRIFLPDEIIPIPTTKAISIENFTIEYTFDAEDNEISELVDIFEDNIKYEQSNIEHTYPTILFIMNNITYTLAAEYSTIFNQRLSNFIEKIERDLFSYLIVDEYNYTKLICWTSNNRCRLKIQNYDDDRVVLEPIDFIIEKNELIKIFKKFKESIFCKHNEFVTLINKMRKNDSI